MLDLVVYSTRSSTLIEKIIEISNNFSGKKKFIVRGPNKGDMYHTVFA
jgi:hypothetical protein